MAADDRLGHCRVIQLRCRLYVQALEAARAEGEAGAEEGTRDGRSARVNEGEGGQRRRRSQGLLRWTMAGQG